MGGDRETVVPSKSSKGSVIGNLRVHESRGEIHFHDDDAKLKVAIPVAEMYDTWAKLKSGKKQKFKYVDSKNGTRLRINVVRKDGKNDLQMSIKRVAVDEIVTGQTDIFKQFEKFING